MSGRFVQHVLISVGIMGAVAVGLGLVYLHQQHASLLSVQSGSMVPALHKGDLVVVKRFPASQLAVGDVVTFMNPANAKQTLTHRIISIQKDQLTTQGDANAVPDQSVYSSAVLGKVIRHAPLVGYGVDLVRKPLGLALLIYLPALVIAGGEYRRLMQYYKKRQHVYRLKGWREQRAPRGTVPLVPIAKVILPCLLVILAVSVPVRAAFQDTASLTGTTITTAPRTADHVLISRVEFECTNRNTAERNNMFIIALHNATDTKLKIDGWYLESSSGKIVTFKSTTLWAHRTYPEEYRVQIGLRFAGDFIALRDKTGALIDSLSWGDNTSQFSPALPVVAGGNTVTTFKRATMAADNNTAAEWTVTVSNP